jgi:exopolyphosphatase/guanosine-5'-triphosphate,3'-diphosphate pyrophosphatase
LISVALGCVRMTERHLKSDPPTQAELDACLDDIHGVLRSVSRAVPTREARTMIGLAGTITSLASLQLGLKQYDASRTHHSRLRRGDVERMFQQLSAATIAERRTLLAEPKRAEVIAGGAAVLVTILRDFGIDELLVSETDILDGLAASVR